MYRVSSLPRSIHSQQFINSSLPVNSGSPHVVDLSSLNGGMKLELSQRAVLGTWEWDYNKRDYSLKGIYCSKLKSALYTHFISIVISHGKRRKKKKQNKFLNPNFVQSWGMMP